MKGWIKRVWCIHTLTLYILYISSSILLLFVCQGCVILLFIRVQNGTSMVSIANILYHRMCFNDWTWRHVQFHPSS